jgi:TRAP-type C4-dicarboxylate transport system permease small subunit
MENRVLKFLGIFCLFLAAFLLNVSWGYYQDNLREFEAINQHIESPEEHFETGVPHASRKYVALAALSGFAGIVLLVMGRNPRPRA